MTSIKILGVDGLNSSDSGSDQMDDSQLSDAENEKAQKQNRILWVPTKFYRINGIYDFNIGCPDSLLFLRNYSKSKNKDFVLSNWRHIIDYKWQFAFKVLIPISVMFWVYSIFLSLYLLLSNNLALFIINIFIVFFICMYEAIQIKITGFRKYLINFYNLTDLILIILGLIVLILTYVIENI